MANTLEARVKSVVFDHLDASLRRVREDLQEIGVEALDLTPLAGAAKMEIEQFFSKGTGDGESQPALFEFGANGSTSPAQTAVARSLAICGVRAVIDGWTTALAKLEKIEDEKIACWAKSRFGNRARVNFRRIAVEEGLALDDDQIAGLRVAREVLDASPGVLAKAAAMRARSGIEAFAGDFARAALSSESVKGLLNDLWDAATPEDVDAVLAQVSLDSAEYDGPVQFYASLVRELARLSASEREQVMARIRR